MKKLFLLAALFTIQTVFAQKPDAIINEKEVERIERFLASDSLKGRRTFSEGIDKAADFIAAEFKKAGLKNLNGADSYFQEFKMIRSKFISAKGTADGKEIKQNNIIAFTTQESLTFNQQSGYEKILIGKDENFFEKVFQYVGAKKNYLVWIDTSHIKEFIRLRFFKGESFPSSFSSVFVLGSDTVAKEYSFDVQHKITELPLKNVVGILPGRSKKEEYVVFSAHYDHIGTGKPEEGIPQNDGDTIYNGANDDAAGTTAVVMLAKYFSRLKNNERTIVFAAFTAEEIGGYGSRYFSEQLSAEKVMAMFNIEMIGTESKWGTNSAYITGFDKTDMGTIMQENLKGSEFQFHPDPYPDQQLFYRSDNATLARLGVPAHTISTSKMDDEKNYHTANDEIETLDMKNMARIILAIAISSKTIVAGKHTPTRVKVEDLR
jgi:Peptidase family M28